MVVQCCVCQKIRVKQHWVTRKALTDAISSSYCPGCRIKALKGMALERKEAQLTRY